MCAMPRPNFNPVPLEKEGELTPRVEDETGSPRAPLRRAMSVHDLRSLEWGQEAQEMESLSDSNSDPDEVEQDEPEEIWDVPDLALYFSKWPNLDAKQKIKMARAYAALLAAQEVAREPPAKKKVRFE